MFSRTKQGVRSSAVVLQLGKTVGISFNDASLGHGNVSVFLKTGCETPLRSRRILPYDFNLAIAGVGCPESRPLQQLSFAERVSQPIAGVTCPASMTMSSSGRGFYWPRERRDVACFLPIEAISFEGLQPPQSSGLCGRRPCNTCVVKAHRTRVSVTRDATYGGFCR